MISRELLGQSNLFKAQMISIIKRQKLLWLISRKNLYMQPFKLKHYILKTSIIVKNLLLWVL